MNRRIFPWFVVAIPATLVGHALTYFLTGRDQADSHHTYMVPALEYSVVLLIALGVAMLFRALSRPGLPFATSYSLPATWAKLSIAQIALFTLIERLEGFAPAPIAYAVEVFVALVAALAIAHFAQMVRRCERSTIQASEYLRRCLAVCVGLRFAPRFPSLAYALTVSAGVARFQRPPPQL